MNVESVTRQGIHMSFAEIASMCQPELERIAMASLVDEYGDLINGFMVAITIDRVVADPDGLMFIVERVLTKTS